MDERCALALFVYPLEVDNEAARIMLGEGEDLGAEEGHDVVGDDVVRFGLEVGVVDAEAVVEPVDLVGDEFAGDKALDDNEIRDQRGPWMGWAMRNAVEAVEQRERSSPWPLRPARREPAVHPCP